VDLATFLAEDRLGANRYESAGGYDAGTSGAQKRSGAGKDPRTAAVDGPSVHGRRVVMGEFLQGGDIAAERVACCQGERNLHGRERDSAIESQLPGFRPGGGRMSGGPPRRAQLRTAAAGGGILGQQGCPFPEGSGSMKRTGRGPRRCTMWCFPRSPRQLGCYALTYPFGFSTNFVAEPASNSA
jgi:hypothetical protein